MLHGNAIVGQSGGPTAAINATLAGVISGAFDCAAIDTIYGAFNGVEGMLADHICNLNEVFANRDDLRGVHGHGHADRRVPRPMQQGL